LRAYTQQVDHFSLNPPGLPTLLLLSCGCAFLLGSIPFGLLIAAGYGVDIRSVGSGNIGMTNVWRTLGWRAGLTVFVLDVLKGWLPVVVIAAYLHHHADFYVRDVLGVYAATSHIPVATGLSAILGHTFTPWLRFKGGKGVATGLGVAIGLFGLWILVPLGVFLMMLLVTRMVSASSIIAALSLVIVGYHLDLLGPLFWFALLGFFIVLYTHRSNIKRILSGTENKVSFGRKPSAPA
jgi:glycerol-3-phosphate acyltransferase PlsY